jgi:predicted nucleic acid-binding protein
LSWKLTRTRRSARRRPSTDDRGYYADIVNARRRAGSPIEGFDALIAAIASAAGADIATRDGGGFDGCGLSVIDPWDAQ